MKFLKSSSSKVIALLILVAIVAFAIYASFSFNGSTKHSSALPSDITALIKIDVKESVSEMGFNLIDILGEISKGAKKETELDINLAKSGIDFKSSIYCFTTTINPNNIPQFGCILPISDSKEFKDFLNKIFSSISNNEEKLEVADGVSFYLNNNFFIGFDDNKCLLLANKNNAINDSLDNLKSHGLKLMNQKANESGNRSKLYSLLGTSPISAAISGDNLIKSMGNDYNNTLLLSLSPYDLSEVYYLANMDFMNNGASLNVTLDSDNEDFNKIMEKSLTCFGGIDGDRLNRFSYDDAFFAATNIDGKNCFNQIKSSIPKEFETAFDAIITQLKQDSVDVEKMCEAIDGDIYYSFPDIDINAQNIPPMTLLAKAVNDSSINVFSPALAFFGKAQDNISIKKDGDRYVISQSEIDWEAMQNKTPGTYIYSDPTPIAYFGEHDGYLYLSSVNNNSEKIKGNTMKDMKSKISGNNIFITFNLMKVSSLITSRTINQKIDILDRLNIFCKGYSATVELFFNKSWKELYKEYNK